MSLTVVITPFTVTVATAVLEEDQLKFPLPPVACHKHKRIRMIMSIRMIPLIFDRTFRVSGRIINTGMKKTIICSFLAYDRFTDTQKHVFHTSEKAQLPLLCTDKLQLWAAMEM